MSNVSLSLADPESPEIPMQRKRARAEDEDNVNVNNSEIDKARTAVNPSVIEEQTNSSSSHLDHDVVWSHKFVK